MHATTVVCTAGHETSGAFMRTHQKGGRCSQLGMTAASALLDAYQGRKVVLQGLYLMHTLARRVLCTAGHDSSRCLLYAQQQLGRVLCTAERDTRIASGMDSRKGNVP